MSSEVMVPAAIVVNCLWTAGRDLLGVRRGEPAADSGAARDKHDWRKAGRGKGDGCRNVCVTARARWHVCSAHAGQHWSPESSTLWQLTTAWKVGAGW
jgi:hypothetical protein